jgi:uncharacterized protein with beta-barrel porin domain
MCNRAASLFGGPTSWMLVTENLSPGKGGSVGFFLKVGYDVKVGGFRFGPVVSGQYTYLGVTPFTESGADSLNLRVRQQNLNSLQLNVWRTSRIYLEPCRWKDSARSAGENVLEP